MNTKGKVLLVTLLVAIPAFLLAPQTPLGQQVWPEPRHDVVAEGAQVPLFMALGVMEALLFGLGVAYLAFGREYSRAAFGEGGLGTTAHLGLSWIMMNWWLHDNLHFWNGMDLWGLVAIDYAFHTTLMASGLACAWALVKRGQARGAGAAA